MNAQHTPGPWHVVANAECAISIMPEMFRRKNAQPNDPASYGFETGIGHAVAFVEGWTNDDANSRLIAAAPDLLAALNGILPFIAQSSASEGGAAKYSDAVRAADAARAAIARARGE